MTRTLLPLLLLAASLSLDAQTTHSVQSWTSNDGKVIQAQFIRMEADAVVIEREGKTFTIPLTKLTPGSIELAKKLEEKAAGEGATETDTANKGDAAAIIATKSTIRFRWLQTDPTTGEAIVNVIKANELSADVLSTKIDQQIKDGKIREVAFERKIISGEEFVWEPPDDTWPQMLKGRATAGSGRWMSLVVSLERNPKMSAGTRNPNGRFITGISHQYWHLLDYWSDAKTASLLLACGGFPPTKPSPVMPAMPQSAPAMLSSAVVETIHIDAEWRETTASDLAKLVQAPPESRAKALVWLRERSTLLARATNTSQRPYIARHEHLWGGKSDAELKIKSNKRGEQDAKEPPPSPVVMIESVSHNDGRGWFPPPVRTKDELPPPVRTKDDVHLHIHSPENSVGLVSICPSLNSQNEYYETGFRFEGILRPGVPEFVAAKAVAQQGQPVVVLVLLSSWNECLTKYY